MVSKDILSLLATRLDPISNFAEQFKHFDYGDLLEGYCVMDEKC